MAKSPKFPRHVGNKSKCLVVRQQPTNKKFSVCDNLKSFTIRDNSVSLLHYLCIYVMSYLSRRMINKMSNMHAVNLLVRRITYCAFTIHLILYWSVDYLQHIVVTFMAVSCGG